MLGSECIEATAARRSYLCVIVRFVHLPGNFSFFSRLETWVRHCVYQDMFFAMWMDLLTMTIIHEPKDWWMWVCCHLQSIHVNSSTCNNWQVISALADADKFGGCRFQWIRRRESPFRRRVASKVFPGAYGSVTCVGLCFLRCKPSKWQSSSKFRACGDLLVICYVESEILFKLRFRISMESYQMSPHVT